MVTRQLMVLASVFATLVGGAVMAKVQGQYIRVAHIEIDPAQIEAYKAAVSEEIKSSVRLEPGVLALYAVSDKDNSAKITVKSATQRKRNLGKAITDEAADPACLLLS